MLIFNFFMYSFVCGISLSIVLTVLSMYFIGVSGLRVLPLSINGMELRCIRPYLDFKTPSTIATSIVHSKLGYFSLLLHVKYSMFVSYRIVFTQS